jgi:hypothetical protein
MTAPAAAAPAAAPAPGEAANTPADANAAPAGNAQVDPPAGEKPAETDEQKAERVAAEAAEAAKNAGAPEKYEPFTPPEGGNLDPAVMDQFAEAARALNLPQDKAQQLINTMAPVIAARQAEQVEAVRAEWGTQSTADKEFGGDKLPENLAVATKAMTAFGTPELTKLLNDTGLGNHPEVIRFMYRTGKAMSEDKVITGGVPASGIRSTADLLYPSSSSK